MKKLFSKLCVGGVLLFSLSVSLTSCEDVLGKWEKPVPQVPSTVVEEVKVLGAALEAGATVAINYKVGTTEYIATFQKGDGDTYTLISNYKKPSAARAMTRSVSSIVSEGDGASLGDKMQLKLVGNNLLFSVMTYVDSPLFEALINVVSGEVTVHNTNAVGYDCTIGGFSVNDAPQNIKVPEMQSVKVLTNNLSFAVKYIDGESWADVAKRNDELTQITTTTDGYVSVILGKQLIIETLKGNNGSATAEQLENAYNTLFSGTFYLYVRENSNLNSRAGTRAVSYIYTPIKSTDAVDGSKTYILGPAVSHELTSAVVGEIVGDDGKAYAASDKDKLSAIRVEAVALVAYVGSETGVDGKTNGLALALKDEPNTMDWSNAKDGAVSHDPAAPTFITSSWMLPSNVQWTNMISAAGGYAALRDGFSSVGGDNLQSVIYWSSTEEDSDHAWGFDFGNSTSSQFTKSLDVYRVRACLAF